MSDADELLDKDLEQLTKEITIGANKYVVRELTILEFGRYGSAMSEGDKDDKDYKPRSDDERLQAIGEMLAAVVTKPDGTPRFTVEQGVKAARKAIIGTTLLGAIMELSGFKADEGKKG